MSNSLAIAKNDNITNVNYASADLKEVSKVLEKMNLHQRVEWSLEHLPGKHIVSSSFGAQSAVMLHLLNTIAPNIPVVLTDTGYLFKETYQFIDQLQSELNLNLKVYKAELTQAWQEARFGKLWEQGVDGIEQYNKMNKVEPMQTALKELDAKSWFAGLRRSQSNSRKKLSVLQKQGGHFKIHPILDLDNRDLHKYMKKNKLPYHPLWEQGFVSIGDWHTSSKLKAGMTEEETRFFGLKRECGLHEFGDGDGI